MNHGCKTFTSPVQKFHSNIILLSRRWYILATNFCTPQQVAEYHQWWQSCKLCVRSKIQPYTCVKRNQKRTHFFHHYCSVFNDFAFFILQLLRVHKFLFFCVIFALQLAFLHVCTLQENVIFSNLNLCSVFQSFLGHSTILSEFSQSLITTMPINVNLSQTRVVKLSSLSYSMIESSKSINDDRHSTCCSFNNPISLSQMHHKYKPVWNS